MLNIHGLVKIIEVTPPEEFVPGSWALNMKIVSKQQHEGYPDRWDEYDAVMYFNGPRAKEMLTKWIPRMTKNRIVDIRWGTLERSGKAEDDGVHRGRFRVRLYADELRTSPKWEVADNVQQR